MPTYAYECSNCGEQFERVQKFTDPPVTRCPNCKKNKVRRILQPTPIVFKGSGWYITDHRSNTKKSTQNLPSANGDKAEKKSDAKADASDAPAKSESPKSESKSESKAESKSSKAGSDD
jgi:putative FmdB family regulatory protein